MTKQIASIYFAEVAAGRALYGGYYRLPAVPKGGEPVLLTIEDRIQRSQEPSPDGKTKAQVRYMVEARDIATDILREWTRETVGMSPSCQPGMWMVRDEVPVIDEQGRPEMDADHRAVWRLATATEKRAMWDEDLATARACNDNWGDYLIRQGDVLAEEPKQWVLISSLMKTAARHYGKEREWLQELKDSDIKKCPFCTKSIAIAALKCPNCQEVVDVERYAQEKARQEAVMDAAKSVPARPPVARPVARA